MSNALIHRSVKHGSLLLLLCGLAAMFYACYTLWLLPDKSAGKVPDYVSPVASLSTDLARESLTLLEQDLLYISNLPLTRSAFFELDKGWKELDDVASSRVKQLYVTDNPYGEEKKEYFDFAPDGSAYSAIHKEHHPRMRSLIQSRNYDDLLFITNENEIIYSVFKPAYFADALGKAEGLDKNIQAILQKPLETNHLITISPDDTGKGTILAAYPITSPFGESLGKLVILSDLEMLHDQVGADRQIYLTDSDLSILHVVSGDVRFFQDYLLPLVDTSSFSASAVSDQGKQLGYVIARPIELAGQLYYAVHFFPHQSATGGEQPVTVKQAVLLVLGILLLVLSHLVLRMAGLKSSRMLRDALQRLATGKAIRGNLAYLDQAPFGEEIRRINKHFREQEEANPHESEMHALQDKLAYLETEHEALLQKKAISEEIAEAEPLQEETNAGHQHDIVHEAISLLDEKVARLSAMLEAFPDQHTDTEMADILRDHRVDLQEYDELVQDAVFRVGRLAEQSKETLESWETSTEPEISISKGSISSALEVVDDMEARIRPIIESGRAIDPHKLADHDIAGVKQEIAAIKELIVRIQDTLQTG